jgi:hypothetical protein
MSSAVRSIHRVPWLAVLSNPVMSQVAAARPRAVLRWMVPWVVPWVLRWMMESATAR